VDNAGTILGRQPVLFMTAIQIAIIGIIANRVVTPVAFPSLPEGTTVEVVTPKGEPNKLRTL
jgi:hypothetical protein